jgi:very-short-patch-repair endonuclease
MKPLRNDPTLKQRRRELRRNQTEAEKMIWSRLRNGLFLGMKFFRQYSIGPYIVDFYCPKRRLAIELDGGQHAEDDTRRYDAERSAYLRTQGIKVMRFWNNDVLIDTEAVLAELIERITPPNPHYLKRGMERKMTRYSDRGLIVTLEYRIRRRYYG